MDTENEQDIGTIDGVEETLDELDTIKQRNEHLTRELASRGVLVPRNRDLFEGGQMASGLMIGDVAVETHPELTFPSQFPQAV